MKPNSNSIFLITRVKKKNTQSESWLIVVVLHVLMMLLVMSSAYAEEPYRFDRVWPNLQQSWHFNDPVDVAVGPDGLIYVVDKGNNRIQVFSEDGYLVRSLSGTQIFRHEGLIPLYISVSTQGTIYVIAQGPPYGEYWVNVLDRNGEKRSWYMGAAADSDLAGIAANTNDFSYILDSGNIKVFDNKGQLIATWDNLKIKGIISWFVSAISVNQNNEIYALDEENNQIHIFDDKGNHIRSFKYETQLSSSMSIAIDMNGFVYLSDHSNHRVQAFNAQGKFVRGWGGHGAGEIQFDSPTGIAVNTNGLIYVTDTNNNRIQVLNTAAGFNQTWEQNIKSDNGQFDNPKAIAVDANNQVYVADTGNHRVQVFDTTGQFISSFGGNGSGLAQFKAPEGIAISSDNHIYVVDTGNHRVQVFDTTGGYIRTWGSKEDKVGKLHLPRGIALSNNDEAYVLDGDGSIDVFDYYGKHIRSWDIRDGDSLAARPTGIAIGPADLIYITSLYGSSLIEDPAILVFDKVGNFSRMWRTKGLGFKEGVSSSIGGITVSDKGFVYVANTDNSLIQVYNYEGNFIKNLAFNGSGYGQVTVPSDIAINSEGELFITDAGNNRIQKFVRGKTINTAHPHKAIILAGGGPTESNRIWNETIFLTNKAKIALSLQGFQKDEIKYLTAGNTQSDLDNNGQFDDLESATLTSLQEAITQWATDATDVVIYLADHGGPGLFQLNAREKLNETQLSQWIAQLDTLIPGKVTVVIEACNSGSFITPLAATQRYLIASADNNQPAVISNRGLNAFSYFFWSEINGGAQLKDAFKAARQGMSKQQTGYGLQKAQLDSNGDQQFNSTDYTTLGDFCLGNCTKYASLPPEILSVAEPEILNGKTQATLSMQVNSLEGILETWAVVTRPDFHHPDSNEPVSELPKLPLKCDDKQFCSAVYKPFDLVGDYQITYFVLDKKGQLAIPVTTTVTQTQGRPVASVIVAAGDTRPFSLNDFSESGSLISIQITTLAHTGKLILNGRNITSNQVITAADIPRLTYQPAASVTGEKVDSFQFTVNDGGLLNTTVYTLTIDIGKPTPDSQNTTLGTSEITHNWSSVMLPGVFTQPVVIAASPSFHGAHPGVVRIQNITPRGYEVRFQEWDYMDGRHKAETLPYLVLEAGRHRLSDGSIWEVGTYSQNGTGIFQTQSFSQSFTDKPELFMTLQTSNGGQAVTVRARNVTINGFDSALYEQESLMDGHATETVGYLAIHSPKGSGIVTIGGQELPYIVRQAPIDHRWTPVLSSALKVDEEQSKDEEVRHLPETLSLLGLGPYLFAQDISSKGANPIALRQKPAEYSAPIEWGTLSGITHEWSTIPLSKTYHTPIVVAKLGKPNETDPAVVRIRTVNSDSFQVKVQEWSYLDGNHTGERIHYLVAEQGTTQVAGLTLQAGKLETNTELRHNTPIQVSFTTGYSQSPAVFSSVMSYNDSDTLTTRVDQINSQGFEVSLQEQESKADGHQTETISWIAIEQGTGQTNDGRRLEVSTLSANHDATELLFTHLLDRAYAVSLGSLSGAAGADPATAQQMELSDRAVSYKVNEEASFDAELRHKNENISVFVAE